MKSAISISLAIMSILLAATAPAQTRSVRDTATAYGARLTAKGTPANLNANRINNRVNSRIDNRLSLRIERYRPDATDNPIAAFDTAQTDKTRVAPVIAPPQAAPDQ